MLHHVSLEVPSADVERTVEFWSLLGFEAIAEPAELAGHVTWLERDGNQIHLIHTDAASVPPLGHVAIVAPAFAEALSALAGAGFSVEETRELWSERRAFALAPAGHRVELMAAPPPPAG